MFLSPAVILNRKMEAAVVTCAGTRTESSALTAPFPSESTHGRRRGSEEPKGGNSPEDEQAAAETQERSEFRG